MIIGKESVISGGGLIWKLKSASSLTLKIFFQWKMHSLPTQVFFFPLYIKLIKKKGENFIWSQRNISKSCQPFQNEIIKSFYLYLNILLLAEPWNWMNSIYMMCESNILMLITSKPSLIFPLITEEKVFDPKYSFG